VTSTVSPGQTDGPIREAIERAGGLRCGRDFGLCYSPEFVALGEVLEALREPAWVLIGESDAESGARVEAFFRRLCTNDPPLARLTPLDAELAKLAVNGFLTTRISYANMLAMVCEGLPGADVDAVTRAMGMDPRIGPRALTGAVAYGGPCLPRDNAALSALAERLGVGAELPAATDRTNEAATQRLHERVRALVRPGARVAILGLAYKPDSDVCISAGLDLARRLGREGTPVSAFDPMAMESARRALAGTPHVDFSDDLETALRRAEVAVVATPWECFARLDAGLLERPAGSRLVLVDCWRILDREDVRKRVDYVPLGRGPQGEGSPSERTLDAA
jgi:UDPglucose 6-dehydrogenase